MKTIDHQNSLVWFVNATDAGKHLEYYLSCISSEIAACFDYGIPIWKDRQDRDLDNRLQGIISRKREPIDTFKKLIAFLDEKSDEIKDLYAREKVFSLGIHKFVNFWAEKAITEICISHPRVSAESDGKNPSVDVWVDNKFPLDIKFTVYPQAFQFVSAKKSEETIKTHINNPTGLINWLYKHQGYHRWNWQNRLFVICYDGDNGDHLKMKCDFDSLLEIIWNYFDNFHSQRLISVNQSNINGIVRQVNSRGKSTQVIALADVIWHYKDRTMRPPTILQDGVDLEISGYKQEVMF